ncbi:integrase catalytic domain-containing protein [Trichonephila clavipes]|nr:integrase catalytic domain-containing protein [Trichonephila clavipes]
MICAGRLRKGETDEPVPFLPSSVRFFFGVAARAAEIKGLSVTYARPIERILDRNFYFDDLISGGNELEEALQTSSRAKNYMEAAGMDLRKWITNDADLMEQWKKENFMYILYMKLSVLDKVNKTRWKQFVSNRVNEITCLTDRLAWYHCAGKENPADFLLRGLSADFLVSNYRWWTGAEFFSDSEFPKNFQQVAPELDYLTEHEIETVVQERKKLPEAVRSEETVLLNSDSSGILDEDLELSNNYFKVINILSYIFRFNYNGRKNIKKVGPLTVAEFKDSDADNFDVLTPGHFLIGRSITSIPEPNLIDVNENCLSRWEKITKVVQRTWKKWKSDYLNTLQARSKWITEKNDLMIGEMVLIKEDFLPINTCPLGRILEVYHGSDGKVRVVKVKTQSGEFKRTISKIAVLTIDTK